MNIQRRTCDLISREALKKALADKDLITWTHEYGDAIPVDWLMSAIDGIETAELKVEYDDNGCPRELWISCNGAVPDTLVWNYVNRTGEWMNVDDVYLQCPFCNKVEVVPGKFCRNCGARLEMWKEDEE